MAEQISTTYIPPSLCIGSWTIQNECTEADKKTIENQIAESIEIAGAQINVFKLLGVHEQGKLIDLIGQGIPLSNGSSAGSDVINAYDSNLLTSWQSAQTGSNVITDPAYIGYYFGTKKTITGTERYAPSQKIVQHITTIKIQQGANPQNRVLQARIERAQDELIPKITFTGTGNGQIVNLSVGYQHDPCTIIATAVNDHQFSIISDVEGPLGIINCGQMFACKTARFSIVPGNIAFVVGDMFMVRLELDWKRCDVVNLPDTSNLETVSIRASAPAPYWRIVPILFSGNVGDFWEIVKLEMIDYKATSIDNIQDTLFLENRDRDYAQTSITVKCQYQPFDSVGDLGKFGFSILDQYIFTCSFARMVELLGRPVVVGDVLEVTPELQYDHNLKAVKKYLEVTDCGWSADGYTPQWAPVLYRFQAVQLLPSVEVRDIVPMPEDQLFNVSDGTFFDKFEQVQTAPILTTEENTIVAHDKVPERGEDVQAVAFVEDMPKVNVGNKGMYVEDGMPPNGEPYGEGYKLPDISASNDGDYFRLNYPQHMNIPPRLYKFSLLKNRWIYQETDRRDMYSSHKPSIKNALVSLNKRSLQDTNL